MSIVVSVVAVVLGGLRLDGAVHAVNLTGSDAGPYPLKLKAINEKLYEFPVVKLLTV